MACASLKDIRCNRYVKTLYMDCVAHYNICKMVQLLKTLKINKIAPSSKCPSCPAGVNTGSGGFRQRRYRRKTITKPTLKIKIKNALYHMENLNTLVQFGQVVVMVALL